MKDEAGPIVVVKVGGSLLDLPGLADRLGSFLRSPEVAPCRLLLVAGGGRAADVVREFDATHGVGEERSHRLALRAMDLTAHLLAALIPDAVVIEDLANVRPAWKAGRLPVLAPRGYMESVDERAADPLPLSWRTTSDAIAARIAVRLQAARLVLLKSAGTTARTRGEAADAGYVDPAFPAASRGLGRVDCIDLRDPAGAARVLEP